MVTSGGSISASLGSILSDGSSIASICGPSPISTSKAAASSASGSTTIETPAAWVEDPEVSLVESTLDDAPRLAALYASAAPEDGGIPDEVSLMKSLAAWRHYRLTVTGGEVAAVGYVVPQGGRYVSVNPIVSPAFRGRGWGRYLVGFALNRELAENKIFLATMHSENEAAKSLIESLGARLAAYFVHFSVEGFSQGE